MRRICMTVGIVICIALLPLSAWAQSGSTFYLHTGLRLDQTAPSLATPSILELTGAYYYVWKSAVISANETFAAGTWAANFWMNMSTQPTQYRVELQIYDRLGGLKQQVHSHTPVVESSSATRYEIPIAAAAISVLAGESLALGLLRQWENGSYSPAGFLFFDSPDTASSLMTTQVSSTQPTQPTQPTQTVQSASPGFAFAIVGVGAGVGAAAGGLAVAVAAGGRGYGGQYGGQGYGGQYGGQGYRQLRQPRSDVFAYAGYYYCRKHRVPVWYVQGWLWCPAERRYLRS